MGKAGRIVISLALLLSMGHRTFAQDLENTPKVVLGVRGGVAFAPTEWDGSSIEVSPTVGLSASFRIAKLPFYIETGLYYTNRYVAEWKNRSLLVPALMSYHIPLESGMSIQPFMGPFLAYGFDEDAADFGCRMGVGISRKNFYANCGYDISGTYGVDEDALFVSVGYNF